MITTKQVKELLKSQERSKKVVDSKRRIWFEIGMEDILKAKCGDPQKCVIWQCLVRKYPTLTAVWVGSNITKLITSVAVIRFSTPLTLRKALPFFDATQLWDLPLGRYYLNPPNKFERLGSRNHSLYTQSKTHGFQPTSLPASRSVLRCDVLAKTA